MIKFNLISFCLIILLFSGCANTPKVKPVCRHWTLFNAITYHDLTGKQTRIVVYPIKVNPNISHSEAHSYEPKSLSRDEGWYLLEFIGGEPKPTKIQKVDPPKTYTINEFILHQFLLE